MLEGKSMIKIILIFALLSGSAYASTEKFKITFTATEDGGGMVYEIDTSTVSNLPEWNPDKEEPPLSIKDAVSIAQRELLTQDHKEDMKLATIRLSSASIVGEAKVWYYSVTFINEATSRMDGFVERTFHILMNSDLLVPRKITKEEYEQWFN